MSKAEVLRLSNSKSNTWRRCQKQYEFKYVKKLVPKGTSLALFRGDWLHQLLMVDADGHDWRERHALLKEQNWDNLFDEEKEGLGGNLPQEVERLIRGYKAHWKEEDKLWHVVDTEVKEVVTLPNGMELVIIIDCIVEDKQDGGLWIKDYKTVGRFFPEGFMLLDSQLALYFWGASVQLGYKNLRGVILDELLTKPPTLPKLTAKTNQLERRKNIWCDAYTYYGEIKKHGMDPKDYASFLRFLREGHSRFWRRTPMPRDDAMTKRVVREMMATGINIQTTSELGIFTRTARKECTFDCDYLELCQATLQGTSGREIIALKYKKSNRPPEEDELKKLWPRTAGVPNG